MNESVRRVIRTAYQIVAALIVYIPVVIYALPVDLSATGIAMSLAAWTAVVAGIINALEEAGLIPPWLKNEAEKDPSAN